VTLVFEHPWLGGVFSDPEVSAHLSADTNLARMLWIEAAYSHVLGNASCCLGCVGRTGYTTRLDALCSR
tara:strand:+ start:507 stop:713 length:207 start_codon:yes stop_codon:yes gene_type:complete